MTNRIIIIGAGASGLVAANVLTASNRSVLVIEARDRIGGRIHTIQAGFSLPIEEGAEFIHGHQPLTFSLAKESQHEVTLLSGNRYQLWNGEVGSGELFDGRWEKLTETLGRLKEDIDMASFLDKHFSGDQYEDLRRKVSGFVEGYDAADLHRVSAMALHKEWSKNDDEHQYRITGGYSGLMQFLAEKIKNRGGAFLFSSPVRRIEWSAGGVKIFTDDKMYEGDKVVITIPLGVLQKGMVNFAPALPQHLRALRCMGFGGVIKFFMEFDNAFWQERTGQNLKELAFIFSDASIPTWWSQLPVRAPVLTGWLGGPSAEQLNSDPETLVRIAIESLGYIFKTDALTVKSKMRQWHVANWVKDPWSYGAYTYPTLETQDAIKLLSQPINETIYFAGEALYEGAAMGTVEAALASGHDVARKLLES